MNDYIKGLETAKKLCWRRHDMLNRVMKSLDITRTDKNNDIMLGRALEAMETAEVLELLIKTLEEHA